ncbi:BCCT family transporter [Zunongwangia sp.]|uniref:BCCT family transporter n=1 Tax=Zunongwangia sp. TaxID=1965325 RepID=UPI003AA7F854
MQNQKKVRAIKKFSLNIEVRKNPLFYTAAFILFFFSVFIFSFTSKFYSFIESASIWIREIFGTFYLVLGLTCVLFLLVIAFSKYGRIRLGNSPPQFDRMSWIAMLYSAGMGSGILLRAVQEPAFMFENPPLETSYPNDIIALEFTFYQWGFTAWAFYGIFALFIGYSLFVRKNNILLGTSLPQLKKIRGIPQSIDLLTILTTVFGLVAAIGLGTTQIEGGISHLSETKSGTLWIVLALVFLICLLAFFSAYAGVEKGIKRISNLNIYCTIAVLIFVFIQTDIIEVLRQFFTASWYYITDFFQLSLATGNFNPGKKFLTDWTYYYWAFWLAWAPFTGIFIARISQGRSIREMILGVLLLPSLGSFLWFSVFGGTSFNIIENMQHYNGEFRNVFTSIFTFFEYFPLSNIINIGIILLLISFLVTSVDSAIYVLSMFSDKGSENPKKKYRLIWAVLLLIFSEAIVILGSVKPENDILDAMQKFLIIGSLPFAFLTAIMMLLFIVELRRNF